MSIRVQLFKTKPFMQTMFLKCFFVLLLVLDIPSFAIEVVDFNSPDQHERYRQLIAELRCLVCQNQSLADSNADLAQDMRAVTADMIRNHAEDEEIIKFMTERYGDFVRYRPPLNVRTLALWCVPFLLLLMVLLKIPTIIRGHQTAVLSEADRQKANDLLDKQ